MLVMHRASKNALCKSIMQQSDTAYVEGVWPTCEPSRRVSMATSHCKTVHTSCIRGSAQRTRFVRTAAPLRPSHLTMTRHSLSHGSNKGDSMASAITHYKVPT